MYIPLTANFSSSLNFCPKASPMALHKEKINKIANYIGISI